MPSPAADALIKLIRDLENAAREKREATGKALTAEYVEFLETRVAELEGQCK